MADATVPPVGPTDKVPSKRHHFLMTWLQWEDEDAIPACPNKAPNQSPCTSDDEQEEDDEERSHCESRRSQTASRLPRTSSFTFQRAFFRAYMEKHRADPTHLGTIIAGSCPFVQKPNERSVFRGRPAPKQSRHQY